MAVDQQVFASGVFADALPGFFFVGFAEGGATPATWTIMDVNGPFDLSATFLRGANKKNLVEQGDRDHGHTFVPVTTTTDQSADAGHVWIGGSTVIVDISVPAITINSSHVNTTPSMPAHNHGLTFDPVAVATNIADSRVIDWVGKILEIGELDQYETGTVLAYLGPKDDIPPGWRHMKELIGKFIAVSSASGNTGSDTHNHAHTGTAGSTDDGPHAHTTGTPSSAIQKVKEGFAAGVTGPSHVHNGSNSGAHLHGFTATSDTKDHKPPYREVLFVIKSAGAAAPDVEFPIATNLHIFFDSDANAPGGFSNVTATFNGRLVVGRKVFDSIFGDHGNIDNGNHLHVVDYNVATKGAHTHVTPPAGAGSQVTADEDGEEVADIGHTHNASNAGDHNHGATATFNVQASQVPASKLYSVFKKS